jgi:glycosyltransferase involved in cell wall biosynthesis
MLKKNFGFVMPRFGSGIVGGEATLAGGLAKRLALEGHSVTVVATCAKDNRTWDNFFPVGSTVEDGIKVHRFPVDQRDLEKWIPLQIQISEGRSLTVQQQLVWIEESVNSKLLYKWLNQHAYSFDYLFFIPYLFGTTFWGSLLQQNKAILIPCLHDESYAYLEIIYHMFKSVKGCIFNAPSEQLLANRLYGKVSGGVVGLGFDSLPKTTWYPYFQEDFPYVLYLGRKETMKGVPLLLDLFCYYKSIRPSKLKLVIAGGGDFADLGRDSYLDRNDIIDITRVDEDQKQQLLKHAICLLQPSCMESFSIVIMEAWRHSTPVIVSGASEVMLQHVIESKGGLFFRDLHEFVGALDLFIKNSDIRVTLGNNGRRYVANTYSWSSVMDRLYQVIETIEAN